MRISGPDRRRAWDALAVEEPLEVQLGGQPYQVTMRTPGHDAELVAGLLLSEGIVTALADIVAMRAGRAPAVAPGTDGFNVTDVSLSAAAGVRAVRHHQPGRAARRPPQPRR
jgi:FdhD protein